MQMKLLFLVTIVSTQINPGWRFSLIETINPLWMAE